MGHVYSAWSTAVIPLDLGKHAGERTVQSVFSFHTRISCVGIKDCILLCVAISDNQE